MKLHIHRHLSSKLRVRGAHAHARSEAIGKTANCTFVFSVNSVLLWDRQTSSHYFTTLIQIELFSTLMPKLPMYRSYMCVMYKLGLWPFVILLTMK